MLTVPNRSSVAFSFALSNFVDQNGIAVPLSTFADAGPGWLYLIDSAGVKSGPLPANLDRFNLKNFNAIATVLDPYTGTQSPANPNGWVLSGNGWLPKTWNFQFQATKGTTGTYYDSFLVPFQVTPTTADVGL